MSARAASAPGAGVLDRLQVLRSAPTPLRGAPAATWTPSPRTGVGPLRVPGPGLQPSSHDTTTTRTDPAGSTLARPDFGPKDGVHLIHFPLSVSRSPYLAPCAMPYNSLPPPFSLNRRPERRERDTELSSDVAPPNRPPSRLPRDRALRAGEHQPIFLRWTLLRRPLMAGRSIGEHPTLHRENAARPKPRVVVACLN